MNQRSNAGGITWSNQQQIIDEEDTSLSFEDLQQKYLGSLIVNVGILAKTDTAQINPADFYKYVLKSYNEIDSYLKEKLLFISFVEDYCRILKNKENVPAVLPPREYQTEKDRNFIDRFILVKKYLKGESALEKLGNIITYMEDAARNYPYLQPLVDRLVDMRNTIIAETATVVKHSAIENYSEKAKIQGRQPKILSNRRLKKVDTTFKLGIKKQDQRVTTNQNGKIIPKEKKLEQIGQDDEKELVEVEKLQLHKPIEEGEKQPKNINEHVSDKESLTGSLNTRFVKKTQLHVSKKYAIFQENFRSTQYSHIQLERHPITTNNTVTSSNDSHKTENISINKNQTVFQLRLTNNLTGPYHNGSHGAHNGGAVDNQHHNGCFRNMTVDQHEGTMIQSYINVNFLSNILNGSCYKKLDVEYIEIYCVDNICEMKISNQRESDSDDRNKYQEWYKDLALALCSIGTFCVTVYYLNYSYSKYRTASENHQPACDGEADQTYPPSDPGFAGVSRQTRDHDLRHRSSMHLESNCDL